MQWLNEPAQWSQADNKISVTTDPKTDFWRITHYGFIRDSGHFFFETTASDFIAEVKIRGQYRDLYDQAGIMIRADEKHWIKTGIEYVDGMQNLSAVVTQDHSDWSMTPLPHPPAFLQLRVERRKEAIHLAYWNDAVSDYTPFRLAYLAHPGELQVGIMCASPDGNGFEATFEDYRLTLLSRPEP